MTAIVYISNTGFTKCYAEMLGKKIALPVFELKEAYNNLKKGEEIIFLGWLFANTIKGYRKAVKHFKIKAVCGVGLCETGCLITEVRKANSLPESVPLFTLQGGMYHEKLRGINRWMIQMLIMIMSKNKNPSKDDELKLDLIEKGGNFVSEENLKDIIAWFNNLQSI